MNELKKEITLVSGIAQLSTTLMGTGLFMIPAVAATIAGRQTLTAWILLFICVCPIALTFARLGKKYPNAGGTSYFVKKAFNVRLEKSVAWLFLSVIPVGIPAAVSLAGGFLQQLLPNPISTPAIAGSLTMLLLLLVNLMGSKSSGRLQTFIALGIMLLIFGLWFKGDVVPLDAVLPDFSQNAIPAISSALGVMFWCFVGIEAFAHMGEEFKNPARDFPIAIIIGCLVAGVIYWACTVIVLKYGAYGSSEFENTSIPWLSEKIFGGQISVIVSVIGFFACFASINLYVQSFARMVWSQAREYKPNNALTHLSSRGVPANSTYLVMGIIALSFYIGEISGIRLEQFLKMANGIFVLIYLLAMFSAVRLLSGLAKLLALIALVFCTIVFICLGWSAMYALASFILFALPFKKSTPTSQQAEL
ncbi:L-methionine/branched-chain amino acid transporter [Vibrio viridaestus]|uniref:L-methionine/branched-chain amino acid transporter n=1 Tax=Vibrio viridaestus TaxID=2487322 RepID=A0A3N9TEP7_9VIBR|nr:L-methionine/branched-chain amino acid transporter [Vibrio viridaestus]RQW62701.1 L-methionine/branched-chain amino acid transporter [Vibrio viridaestus]